MGPHVKRRMARRSLKTMNGIQRICDEPWVPHGFQLSHILSQPSLVLITCAAHRATPPPPSSPPTNTSPVHGLVNGGQSIAARHTPPPLLFPLHATGSTPSAYTFPSPFPFPNTPITISTLLLRLPLALSNLALSSTSVIHSLGTLLCHAKSNHDGFSSFHLHQFACTLSFTSSRIARHCALLEP